jgi:hypothetical protein
MNNVIAILRRMEPADYVLDLLAFAGTVTLALVFRWQARDLIWSLWISSLSFGYALMFTAYFTGIARATGLAKLGAALGGLFTLVFILFHFGFFHLVHGMFLNTFFPLLPHLTFQQQSLLTIAPAALLAYWPFVVMTFVARARDFRMSGDKQVLEGAMFLPYVNVIRMHILIFVFAGLQAAKLTHYAILPVLLFYFFPWRVFNRHRKALAAEAARAQPNI